MKTLICVCLLVATAFAGVVDVKKQADEKPIAEKSLVEKKHTKRNLLGWDSGLVLGSGLGYASGFDSYHTGDTHTVVTKTVGIPVAQPYIVPVEKHVAVPYQVPYAVHVDRPYPVAVPKPYAVHVDRPYPVHVDRPVPYAAPYPVAVPVVKQVGVPYPAPYPVAVAKPYAVHVASPVYSDPWYGVARVW